MTPESFRVEIPQAKLDDLQRRLGHINWPHDFENDEWEYGVEASYLRELVDYWRDGFDWRSQEDSINAYAHFRTEIDELPIHFIHERGCGPNPIPLIMSHGWPWTFWDLKDVIGPLTDPVAYGGDAADSFDIVIPSLPGFIFSSPLTRSGVNWATTADLWATLMGDVLGYEHFAAQGGDWGAMVTTQLGHRYSDRLIGIHLTNAFAVPAFAGDRPWSIEEGTAGADLDPADQPELIRQQRKFASHIATHVLHPQTLAYALHDSPVGLLAWMLEKRRTWGDCRGDVESRFSRDFLLTTMSLYWFTDTFVTSARFYAEAAKAKWSPVRDGMPQVPVPTGLSLFEHDLMPGSIDWTATYYDQRLRRIRDDGGHFGPAENPSAIIEDLRDLFRPLR